MFLQFFFLLFCFMLSAVLQVTLFNALPGLHGPANLVLLLTVLALSIVPHVSILVLGLLFSFSLDSLINSSFMHTLAFLVAALPAYYFFQAPERRSRMGNSLLLAGIATLAYELVFLLFFALVQRTGGSLQHFAGYIPWLLLYHLTFALPLFPVLALLLSRLEYRRIQLGTRPLRL